MAEFDALEDLPGDLPHRLVPETGLMPLEIVEDGVIDKLKDEV